MAFVFNTEKDSSIISIEFIKSIDLKKQSCYSNKGRFRETIKNKQIYKIKKF